MQRATLRANHRDEPNSWYCSRDGQAATDGFHAHSALERETKVVYTARVP